MKYNRRHSVLLLNVLRWLLVLALLPVPGVGYAQESPGNSDSASPTPTPPVSFGSQLQAMLADEAGETVSAGTPDVFEQGDWGYAVIDIPHGTYAHDHGFEVYLGRYKADSGWSIVSSQTTSAQMFNALLQQLPETLMDEATKAFLTRVELPSAVTKFSGHKFPWPSGQTGYVTRKNGNGHGNQIDFDILGRGTNGDVYASKSGKVVFVKESSNSGWCSFDAWKRANMVVIQHSNNEYSWYVHLAHNSVPVSVGQNVGWGTKIGVEGNTGYSCGVHLHFQVSSGHTGWTDPNNANDAPWTTGIDAVDFDEARWDNIWPGPYTSQNRSGGGTTPPPNRSPNRPSPSSLSEKV